jgi:hypothetical protein
MNDVVAEYERQYAVYQKAWDAFIHERACMRKELRQNYTGPYVDYGEIGNMCRQVLQDKFGLTPTQAGYVYGKADDEKHAHACDIYPYAAELAEFVAKFPKE